MAVEGSVPEPSKPAPLRLGPEMELQFVPDGFPVVAGRVAPIQLPITSDLTLHTNLLTTVSYPVKAPEILSGQAHYALPVVNQTIPNYKEYDFGKHGKKFIFRYDSPNLNGVNPRYLPEIHLIAVTHSVETFSQYPREVSELPQEFYSLNGIENLWFCYSGTGNYRNDMRTRYLQLTEGVEKDTDIVHYRQFLHGVGPSARFEVTRSKYDNVKAILAIPLSIQLQVLLPEQNIVIGSETVFRLNIGLEGDEVGTDPVSEAIENSGELIELLNLQAATFGMGNSIYDTCPEPHLIMKPPKYR